MRDRLVAKIERNADPKMGFSPKIAMALADAFGVTTDEQLLDGTPKRDENGDA